MKHLFVILMLLISTEIYSQTFLNHKIAGTTQEFARILHEQNSYHMVEHNNLNYHMEGVVGNDFVDAYILSTPSQKQISQIIIVFESIHDWRTLVQKYEYIKKKLTNKYGKPVVDIVEFIYPYEKDDGFLLSALDDNMALYRAEWANGIVLTIQTFYYYWLGNVIVTYNNLDVILESDEKLSDDL